MNKWIKIPGFILIAFNIVLSAWSVLHNNIYYYTDIGRDFMIFDEIVTKKVVIFGPRADMQGLFHGIMWHYLNVPAYILGNGNPVVQGWFWIGLTIFFLASVYYVVKKMFDEESALIATVFASGAMVSIAQGFFHGNGAMIIMPWFFYSYYLYTQKKQLKVLILHLITVGLLVQFEIALGVPLAILSVSSLLVMILRKRLFTHILGFAMLMPFAATFLIIELKYNFLQFRSFYEYIHGARDGGASTPFMASLADRVFNIGTHAVNIIQEPLHTLNFIFFALLLASIVVSLYKRDKNRYVYISFLFLYFGFYALTMVHGGFLIMFWWLPMSVLPIMLVPSIKKYIPKSVFYGLVLIAVVLVIKQNIGFIQAASATANTSGNSWSFRYGNAQKVVSDAPDEYGYFIYAPDIYGYQDKYAMFYANRMQGKHGIRFEKRAVTYVLSEPPPKDFNGSNPDWWAREKLKITSKPVKLIKLNGGYEMRKYIVSEKDLKTPSLITPYTDWLFYR